MYHPAKTLGLLVGLAACQTVVPSTTLQEKQGDSYVGMDFEEVDNGLIDCNIPFDDLTRLSPDCKKPSSDPHKRCEGFSPSQFPEIVKVENISYTEFTKANRLCSGTVIAANWVLSAAHCFLGDTMPASKLARGHKDLIVSLAPGAVQVDAENAITLKPDERSRDVTALVIPTNYTGNLPSAPYLNDLALLRLSTPFPSRALRPLA